MRSFATVAFTAVLVAVASTGGTVANPSTQCSVPSFITSRLSRHGGLVGRSNMPRNHIGESSSPAFATPERKSEGAAVLTQTTTPTSTAGVRRDYETYQWTNEGKTHKINYRVEGPEDGTPIMLVHGFGANVNHFRSQFPALAQEGYRVYALDLLGFGASDKPTAVEYCIELWVQLLVDFMTEMKKEKKWVVAGNSIGGLCSLAVASKMQEAVGAVVLLNCAGGMTGFRYEELPIFLRPFLWAFQNVFLRFFGPDFFSNFKTRENVESILRQGGVYVDQKRVDEELLEILLGPSDDEGAQDVFLKVFGGPPGPTPESLLPLISSPILAIWGDSDPWTPVDRGMHPGCQFSNHAPQLKLVVLPDTGHCPHDERPELVHAEMIPWLRANLA